MKMDLCGHPIYLIFRHQSTTGGPACRVLGPYLQVRFAALGLCAVYRLGEEPVTVAVRKDNLDWQLEGSGEEWGTVEVFSPNRLTTAAEIEAEYGWIRSDG